MFASLTIGKRIGLGFSVVLILLAGVTTLSYTGVRRIVRHADEVITGNKLQGDMAQNELAHFVWTDRVSALLTDAGVTSLDVEVDPARCSFGQWLHGPRRQHAEATVPELAALFATIEKHHANLH
jgi:methyl-accepting chemotaxis protein